MRFGDPLVSVGPVVDFDVDAYLALVNEVERTRLLADAIDFLACFRAELADEGQDVVDFRRGQGTENHVFGEAAKQFRREQARSLIQRCKITVLDSTPTHVRAFISLPSDRESGGGYRMTANVLGNEDMKEEFMHDIQLTIARWTKKLHLLDIDLAKLIVQLENEIKHREFEKETEARV